MRRLFVILLVASLTGCAGVTDRITGFIPSFSDPNQSAKIIDVRQSVEQLDCDKDQLPQAVRIRENIRWFILYSESRGKRDRDVIAIVTPMLDTVNDMIKRAEDHQGSKGYCEIKKKIMQSQSERAAATVLGRF